VRLKLKDYQVAGQAKIRGQSRIALYMEMRLGKTVMLTRWVEHHMRSKPASLRALVVSRLSTLPGWRDHLRNEGHGAVLVRGDRACRRELCQGVGWRLIGYESLRESPEILDMDWDVIALDESTAIRKPKPKISNLLCNKTRAPYRAVLSGLPAPESPLDYYPQMHFLHRQFMGIGGALKEGYYSFRQKHFRQGWDGYTWTVKPASARKIRQAVAETGIVLSRADVNLGSCKIHERRVVPMNEEQERLMTSIKEEYSAVLASGKRISTTWSVAKCAWLSRIAGGFDPDGNLINDAKIHELVDIVTGELRGEPVLVWFNYNEEKRHAVRALMDAGVSVADIDGSTDLESRHEYCKLLNSGKIQALCFQVRTGLFGLDLAKASTAIYYSNAYDGELRQQSEDRMIKITKDQPCLYVDMVSEGSADERALELLKDKKLKSRYFMAKIMEGYK